MKTKETLRIWELARQFPSAFAGLSLYEINACWEWYSEERCAQWMLPPDTAAEVEQIVREWFQQ